MNADQQETDQKGCRLAGGANSRAQIDFAPFYFSNVQRSPSRSECQSTCEVDSVHILPFASEVTYSGKSGDSEASQVLGGRVHPQAILTVLRTAFLQASLPGSGVLENREMKLCSPPAE